MALEADLGLDNTFCVGDDKNLDLEVLDDDDVPVDITGWTGTYDMRESDHAAAAILSISTSVTGVYNADRETNTQRLRTAFARTQTSLLQPGLYRYSIRRTTSGSSTVLRFGSHLWREATQK